MTNDDINALQALRDMYNEASQSMTLKTRREMLELASNDKKYVKQVRDLSTQFNDGCRWGFDLTLIREMSDSLSALIEDGILPFWHLHSHRLYGVKRGFDFQVNWQTVDFSEVMKSIS